MKSDFFKKFKTWSVLTLAAFTISGMTACSDDKDDPTPPNPEPVAATYSISGTVYSSDATTAMSGVNVELSGAKSATTTTGNDGAYKFDLSTTSGSFTVKFSKEGYKTMSVPVIVSAIASGTIDYSVNAALVKEPTTEPEPEKHYKTATYSLSIDITDVNGKAIDAQDLVVAVKGGDVDITKKEASFELPNLKPGIYSVHASATGYEIASGKVLINEVTEKVEGEGTYVVKTGATFTMKTVTLTPEEASYNISGKITDADGKAVTSTITLSCSDESFATQTINASEFNVAKINPTLVDTGATFSLTVKAEGYYSYSWNFKLNKVAAGQTWNEVINIVLSKVVVIPDPTDPDPTPDTPGTEVTKPSTEVTADYLEKQDAVEDVVDQTDGEGNITGKVVMVENGKTVDLGTIEAKETNTSGETIKIIDKVSFTAPAGNTEAKIVIPHNGIQEQLLSVKRDVKTENTTNKEQNLASLATGSTGEVPPVSEEELADEKTAIKVPVAAVERVFVGEPTGTQFIGAPLTIESPAPTGVAANDPVDLPMALLTSNDGIIWKAAPADMGSATCKDGKMIIEVNHFSMFAPGFEMEIAKINSKDMETVKKDTKYSGKIFTKDSFIFTTAVEDGLIYVGEDGKALNYPAYTVEEMSKQVFSGLNNATDTKEYLFNKLLDKIKADNSKVYPSSGTFAKKNKEFTVPVERNTTIDYIELTTTYIVKVYSIKVGNTTYKIGVKSVNNQTVKVVYKSEHGHGHGEDANAGGGIVDFE